MNSFDCELGELFPSENHANMGNHSNQTNDVLLEIFKAERFLSVSQLDSAKTGLDTVGFVSADETEFQNQGIFDFIADPCFKETPNYSSLLDFDEVLDTELPKYLSNEQARSSPTESFKGCDSKTDHEGQTGGNDLCVDTDPPEAITNFENGDSCIHKIVDLLATIVDEASPNCEINFNTDISDAPKNTPSNLLYEFQIYKETLNPKQAFDSSSLTTATHSDLIFKEKFSNDNAHLIPHENCSLESISQPELETLKKNHTASNVDSTFESNVTAYQQPKNMGLSSQLQKLSRQPLLPQITEFSCKICQPRLFFLSEDDFLQHKQYHSAGETREQKLKCQDCGKTFSVYSQYLNHIRHHLKRKCEVCFKEFLPTSLKNHLRIHDPSQRLLCEHCGKRFVSKIKLNEHLGLHSNKKPYTCELCSRCFSNHGSYWIHKKYHISPFPFNCSCGQSFRHSSVLAKHCRLCGCSKNSNSDISTNSTSLLPHESNPVPNAADSGNRTSPICDSEQGPGSCNSFSTGGSISHPSIESSTDNHHSLSMKSCEEIYPDLSANRCNRNFDVKTIDSGPKPYDSLKTDLAESGASWESCINTPHLISTKTNNSNEDGSGISSKNSENSSGYLSASNSMESDDSAVINHTDDIVGSTALRVVNEPENFKIVVSKCPKREINFKACSKPNVSIVQRVVNGLKGIGKSPFQCERCSKSFSVRGSFLRHQKSLLACSLEVKKQLQSKLEATDSVTLKAPSASFVCEKCLKSFPFKWSLLRHQKSPTACNFGLKKRLQQEQEAMHNIPKKRILVPRLNSTESHCPYCNIQFSDFGSFLSHFQNECNH